MKRRNSKNSRISRLNHTKNAFVFATVMICGMIGCTPSDDATKCPEGQVYCRNRCIDPMTTKRYCGADEACENYTKCDTYQYCVKGVCSDEPDQTCPYGYLICGDGDECLNPDELNLSACDKCKKGYEDCNEDMSDGCEANLKSSRLDCGTCGNACADGNSCRGGKCQKGCQSNEFLCDGACLNRQIYHLADSCEECQAFYGDCNGDVKDGCETNLKTDSENCGVCGNACPPESECAGGKCVETCDETEQRCDEACVKFATAHMKSCTVCENDYLNCDKNISNGCEVEKLTDPNNCGSCGNVCGAEKRCVKGKCVSSCEATETSCQVMGTYVCVNTLKDVYHCGGCNRYCKPEKNAVQLGCKLGSCNYECFPNKNNCGTNKKPVCADLQKDADHCGACYHQCNYPGVEKNACENGVCSIGTCEEDLVDCNKKIEDGCETNIKSDPNHCGGCNQKCNAGDFCNNGVCDTQCSTPMLKCTKDESVECINPGSDVNNCGECGHVCESKPHAIAQCKNSTCTYVCEPGYQNCGTPEAPNCLDVTSDLQNCGGCGISCLNILTGVETAVCESGQCMVMSCKKEFGDCNKDPFDGCEVNLKSSIVACGSCNNSCEGDDPVCQDGTCCNRMCEDKVCGDDGCGGSCGSCQEGECVAGQCKSIPSSSGCSDGTREGFKNAVAYPQIAACSGAWSVPGLHHAGPECDRKSGNTGENAPGTGCNVEDLCAEGWHVCLGKDDVKGRSVNGCTGILQDNDAPYFFAARTSSSGSFNCTPDTVGSSTTNTDDFFGCGNMGCPATKETCAPLELGSHDLCIGIVDRQCTWTDDGNGKIKGSGNMGCNWCKTLDYWNFVLKTDYKTAWQCGSDQSNEANNVTKTDPDSQGGVLCCKNQCDSDSDCPDGKVCDFYVCKDAG